MIPIGTRVSISEQSVFADQIEYTGGNDGIVLSRRQGRYSSKTVWHYVQFTNGYKNSYQACELVISGPIANANFKGLLTEDY